MSIIYIAIGAGVVSLIFALIQTLKILRQDEGNESVRSIGKAIQQGAVAFLSREYRFLAFFVLAVVIILAVFIDYDILDRVGTERSIPSTAIAYLVGAIGSALAGYIGQDSTGVPVAVAVGGFLIAIFAIGPFFMNRNVRNLGTILQTHQLETRAS